MVAYILKPLALVSSLHEVNRNLRKLRKQADEWSSSQLWKLESSSETSHRIL